MKKNPINTTRYEFGNSYDNKQVCLTIPKRISINKGCSPFMTVNVASCDFTSVNITRAEALTILKAMKKDSNTTKK